MTGESPGDAFGCSLSLSSDGSVIAVGARFNDLDGTQSGRSYIFENQDGVWQQIDQPITGASPGDQCGYSIALTQDGSKVAVGSTNAKDDDGNTVGHVRVFENSSIVTIDEINEKDLVKIYPNPASKFIRIQSKDAVKSYELFSIDGRMVERKSVSNLNEFGIDVEELATGMYLLTIQTQSKMRSLKLAIE